MTPEQKTIARGSLLLSNCPENILDDLLSYASVTQFKRGQMLFDHGDPATSIFIVLNGWVKLFRVTPSGAETIVAVLTNGHSFGEAVALQNGTYPVAAEATTKCDIARIPASSIRNMMNSYPEVCMAILSSTFAHLHALVAEIEQLKAHTGAQRVAQFLLSLCHIESGKARLTLPYDKVLIAGRIGMKPESLSRAFARLKSQGVTIRQNHAEIACVESLREYVEEATTAYALASSP